MHPASLLRLALRRQPAPSALQLEARSIPGDAQVIVVRSPAAFVEDAAELRGMATGLRSVVAVSVRRADAVRSLRLFEGQVELVGEAPAGAGGDGEEEGTAWSCRFRPAVPAAELAALAVRVATVAGCAIDLLVDGQRTRFPVAAGSCLRCSGLCVALASVHSAGEVAERVGCVSVSPGVRAVLLRVAGGRGVTLLFSRGGIPVSALPEAEVAAALGLGRRPKGGAWVVAVDQASGAAGREVLLEALRRLAPSCSSSSPASSSPASPSLPAKALEARERAAQMGALRGSVVDSVTGIFELSAQPEFKRACLEALGLEVGVDHSANVEALRARVQTLFAAVVSKRVGALVTD